MKTFSLSHKDARDKNDWRVRINGEMAPKGVCIYVCVYVICLHVYTGDPNFIKQLVYFDKDNISDRVLKKIGTYVVQSDFQPDIVGRVSLAAKSLCMWVRAMELYGRIYRVVEPKRQRLYAAEATLNEKQAQLQEAMDKLAEVS